MAEERKARDERDPEAMAGFSHGIGSGQRTEVTMAEGTVDGVKSRPFDGSDAEVTTARGVNPAEVENKEHSRRTESKESGEPGSAKAGESNPRATSNPTRGGHKS